MAEARLIFLPLSAVGFYLLWIVMLQNGTLDALSLVCQSGVFPNARPLKTVWFGIPPVDNAISTLVGFTDGMTNGSRLADRLLMIDVVSTLQTAALWVTIESLRQANQSSWITKIPALWGLLWNGFGAAVIVPIYCYLHLGIVSEKHQQTRVEDARVLPISGLLTSLAPAVLPLLPPLVQRQPEQHQIIIALFQLTPVYLTVCQQLLSRTFVTLRSAEDVGTEKRFIKQTFMMGAIFSGIAHLYALGTSVMSKNLGISFSKVYQPVPSNVHPATASTVADGAHLFLQYDWIIMSISFALWLCMLLQPYLQRYNTTQWVTILVVVGTSFVVLGPGATVSLGLWWREDLLGRDNSETARKSAKT